MKIFGRHLGAWRITWVILALVFLILFLLTAKNPLGAAMPLMAAMLITLPASGVMMLSFQWTGIKYAHGDINPYFESVLVWLGYFVIPGFIQWFVLVPYLYKKFK